MFLSHLYQTSAYTKIPKVSNLDNVIVIGKVLVELTEVDSTNNYAFTLLKNDSVAEGTVILTDYQYQGRGQRNNEWIADRGKNITLSIILYPKFLLARQQFYLNQAIALGIYHCINDIVGQNVQIKWPNDLYYKDKKMGGILIENVIKGYFLSTSIVGIGLNINQTNFNASLNRATSLGQITQKKHDLTDIIQSLCCHLDQQYLRLRHKDYYGLKKDFLKVLYRKDIFHSYKTKNGIIYVKIVDVSENGELIVEDTQQQQSQYRFKEIEMLFE